MASLVDSAQSLASELLRSPWAHSANGYLYNVLSIQPDKGYWVAFGQNALFFFGTVLLVDAIVPTLFRTRSVQKGEPYKGRYLVDFYFSTRASRVSLLVVF